MKEKPKKITSHFDRCNCAVRTTLQLEFRPTSRKTRTQVFDKETNRLVTKVEFKTVDRAEEMKPFRVSDFYLDNLIAIGATLDPAQMQASPHKAVSDMINTLETITPEE